MSYLPEARVTAIIEAQKGQNYGIAGLTSRGMIHTYYCAMACGKVSITPSAANTPTSAAVTFPAGRFLNAANMAVSLGINSSVPGTVVTGCGVTNVTTTGCTIWVTRTSTTLTDIFWTAMEETW